MYLIDNRTILLLLIAKQALLTEDVILRPLLNDLKQTRLIRGNEKCINFLKQASYAFPKS